MEFDSAFLKTQKCSWADEVDREFSATGMEDKFSQCSHDTWLYYSTSSSARVEDTKSTSKRSNGQKTRRKKERRSKKSDLEPPVDKPTSENEERSGSEGPESSSRSKVVKMVNRRQKEFAAVATTCALSSNLENKRTSLSDESMKSSTNKASKGKKKEVCEAVLDGAVLIVTRRSKSTPKPQPKATNKSKKSRKPPINSPTPTHSRADSSQDWTDDKGRETLRQVDSAKDASRFIIGGKTANRRRK